MDLANPGIMAEFANLPTINDSVQKSLLGQQNIQQNQNVLAQQQRAEQARQAAAVATDPNADPAHRDAAMQALQQADAPAAAALRQQMAHKAAIAAYVQNPTTKGALDLYLTQPDLKDSLDKGVGLLQGDAKQAKLSAVTDVLGYLKSGDVEGAAKIARSHIDADKAAGLPTDGPQNLLDALSHDPKAGLALANMMLVGLAGPDKIAETVKNIGENQRSDELQPGLVVKGTADASKAQTEAQYAAPKIESELATATATRQRMADQTANEQADIAIKRSGLDLERDKLSSTIQLELEKLDRSGTQLDAGGRQAVNTAVGESVGAQALADRMNNLADRIHGTDMSSGAYSTAREKLKGLFGGQDPVTGLRSEYSQLVNQQAVKNLPPGPASDKDIILAKQGFPPASANAAYLESFLRGMAKMQQAVSASSDRKANWISANGSLAPTRRDIDVGGVVVPAGTTFNEYNGNAVKRGRQGEMPAGLSSVLQKYGGR